MSKTPPPEYYKSSPGGFNEDVLAQLSKALQPRGKAGDANNHITEAVTVASISRTDTKLKSDGSVISSSEGTPSAQTEREVRDTWRLVYITMIVHGVGTLMPWNMFINANDYFVKYKLSHEYTGEEDTKYGDDFLSYVGLAAQLPAFVFHWANIFLQFGGNLNKRIIYSLLGEGVVFIFTIILATVDTSSTPGGFFWMTMMSVVVLNVVGGIYQNCIYGIGAKLGCMGGLILGSNICGTFTSLVSLIALALAPTARKAAMFYFSSAMVLIVACLVTYMLLPRNKYYRYKLNLLTPRPSTESTESPTLEVSETGTIEPPPQKEKLPYRLIIKQCGEQCFNIFLIFFVTLTVFPSIYSQIKPQDEEFPIPPKYFVGVTCFLTFNLFALLGTILAEVVQWPKPDKLWIPVICRFIFIPFFIFCNYQPHRKPTNHNVVFNDWCYWVGGALLGFTSGYFCSLAMIYCPRGVSIEHASIAGMFAIAFLVTGIVFGIGLAWVISAVW